MREILFRAKRVDNGEWVDGYPVKYPSGKVVIFKECGEPPDILLRCEINPETLCQYTGLKDKNGNRIWENDILQNARNNDLYTVKWHGSFGMYVWSKRKENNKHRCYIEKDEGVKFSVSMGKNLL